LAKSVDPKPGLFDLPLDDLPFPKVVFVLLKFYYYVTSWSFNEEFLGNLTFGGERGQILLFSVLSFLGETPLCRRVRSLLRDISLDPDGEACQTISAVMGSYLGIHNSSASFIKSGADRAIFAQLNFHIRLSH
jgi:hypothetical protein